MLYVMNDRQQDVGGAEVSTGPATLERPAKTAAKRRVVSKTKAGRTAVKKSAPIGAEQFGKEVAEHIARLRRALRQMLTELGSPRTPTHLQRQLDVGYTICWQLFKVVRNDDASAGTQHAPSLGALKRVVDVAQDKGLTAPTARSVAAAAEALKQFIRKHAEDRDYFDSMVAGTARSQNAAGVLVQRRRAAYRANSHIWGSQNDLWLVSGIVKRSEEDEGKVDLITLSRQQGLRRLRADATVYLMGMKVDSSSGDVETEHDDPLRSALDQEAAATTGMPLLPEFSTEPLPQVTVRTTKNGRRQFKWVDDAVGLQSNCDIATGTINRGIALTKTDDDRRQMYITSSVKSKASALLVLDLLVHRKSFPKAEVRSLIHEADDEFCTLEEARTGHQFEPEERVASLGRANAVNLAEFPQYRSMLHHAAGTAGWDLAEFDAYRMHVPFPVMSAVHRLYFLDPLS